VVVGDWDVLAFADYPRRAHTQVHRARLLDGRDVVVKVKYPYVERVFDSDMATIETFCKLVQPEQVSPAALP
jgi:hypothetical protein